MERQLPTNNPSAKLAKVSGTRGKRMNRGRMEDFDALRRHNRHQIAKYIEHIREIKYPSTAGSLVDTLRFTGKPESSPAMSDKGIRATERKDEDGKDDPERIDNDDTRAAIEPMIEGWLRWYRSDWFYLVERAPLEAENWKAGESQDDREDMAEYKQVLDKLSERFEKKHPGRQIFVHVSPSHEPAKSKVEARNRDNNRVKRYVAEDSYRVIYPRWLPFRSGNQELSDRQARRAFRAYYERVYKETLSLSKIWRAVRYCEGRSTEQFADDGTWWRDIGDRGDVA